MGGRGGEGVRGLLLLLLAVRQRSPVKSPRYNADMHESDRSPPSYPPNVIVILKTKKNKKHAGDNKCVICSYNVQHPSAESFHRGDAIRVCMRAANEAIGLGW